MGELFFYPLLFLSIVMFWLRIVILLKHLAKTSFTDYEGRIIHALLYKYYCNQFDNFIVSLGQLSEMTNIKTQYIPRTVQSLWQRKIINITHLSNHQTQYSFNQNFNEWTVVKPLTVEQKAKIINNHNHTCKYCGNNEGLMHVDHIIPSSRGGTNDEANLTCACGECNTSKGNKTVEEWEYAK